MYKLNTVCIFLILIFSSHPAQSQDLYHIYGYITDSTTTNRIPGVRVEIINQADTSQRAETFSDATGRYVILISDLHDKPDIKSVPDLYYLGQNYPNPFNPGTIIPFTLYKTSWVKLTIYNVLGQKIITLIDQKMNPGSYSVRWDGQNGDNRGVSAGLYFYQLRTADHKSTRKMVLLDGVARPPTTNQQDIMGRSFDKSYVQEQDDLLVTIHCTSPFTPTATFSDILINKENFRYDMQLDYQTRSLINRESVIISPFYGENKVYVSGLPGTIDDNIYGSEKVHITNKRTGVTLLQQVEYHGGFRVVDLLAIQGDTVEIQLVRDGMVTGLPELFPLGIERVPVVQETKPTSGDKDIIITSTISVHFSQPMNPITINDESLYLTDIDGNKVSSKITVLDNICVLLDPVQHLNPLSNYYLHVKASITDLLGTSMGQDSTFLFPTAGEDLDTEIAFSIIVWDTLGGEAPIDRGSIYTIEPDGSGLNRLTKNNNLKDFQPDYSPDASQIVFVRSFVHLDGSYEWSDIYLMNADGTYLENLTDEDDLYAWNPSFSPDGLIILYEAELEYFSQNRDIFVMDPTGYNKTNLTNDEFLNTQPSWTPDGKILFLSNREGERDIFMMNRDGSNPVNLSAEINGSCYWPACSPDGVSIAFAQRWPRSIYLLNVQSGADTIVSEVGSIGKISWDPFSDRLLAGGVTDESYYSGTTVFNLNSGETQNLINTFWWFRTSTPDWAPVRFDE